MSYVLIFLIILPLIAPFILRDKYKSIKGYSIFSITTFFYGVALGLTLLFGFGFDIFFGPIPLGALAMRLILPLAVPTSIISGILSILEIRKKKLKGLILLILGVIFTIMPLLILILENLFYMLKN